MPDPAQPSMLATGGPSSYAVKIGLAEVSCPFCDWKHVRDPNLLINIESLVDTHLIDAHQLIKLRLNVSPETRVIYIHGSTEQDIKHAMRNLQVQ